MNQEKDSVRVAGVAVGGLQLQGATVCRFGGRGVCYFQDPRLRAVSLAEGGIEIEYP